jgi:hypothetical protein
MQTLEEQIITIEKSLGERMVNHALIILRAWLNELGENNPFEETYQKLQNTYSQIFTEWLTSDDPGLEEKLNQATSIAYGLVDLAYVQIRLKRGLSPKMYSFNPDSPQSVMNYFSNNVQFLDSDWEWVENILDDPDKSSVALLIIASLTKNVRECFNKQAMLLFIKGINNENEIIAEQCMANAILLLAHYDVRIDFFPELQNAFIEALSELGDDGELAYQTLCALVRAVKKTWLDEYKEGELTMEDLPEELQHLLELTGANKDINSVMSWLPESEQDYMQGLVQMLPDTWVYDVIVGENEERAASLSFIYLSIGHMDLLWEHPAEAAKWLVHCLRQGNGTPQDYINYAHCLLLQGDRMMAFENYKTARQMCKSPKEFYLLVRPDRRELVDHGIPVEAVYLLEDQLIKN